jgi:hypothetical protein
MVKEKTKRKIKLLDNEGDSEIEDFDDEDLFTSKLKPEGYEYDALVHPSM